MLTLLDLSDSCFSFLFEKVSNLICMCYDELALTELFMQFYNFKMEKIDIISVFIQFSIMLLPDLFFCLLHLLFH